jgi:hypothetical protein
LKSHRYNKVVGLAIGERSLMAAEVSAPASDAQPAPRPQVTHLAELVYPEGVSYATPEALGQALGTFLREQKFTARIAVIGLPAKWLVVKPKEVPPADAATLAEMLRLQAEGDFSTELKDLVYDYTAGADDAPVHADMAGEDEMATLSQTRTVLLIATPRRYVDAAATMCDAARLTAAAVMPSSMALGSATGRVMKRNSLVLTVAPWGAELTAQRRGIPQAIRTLRPPAADGPFVGDLRRAVSSLPAGSANAKRELVMWNSTVGEAIPDAQSLSKSLGISVRNGELPVLGVEVSETGSNGQNVNGKGRQYAPAVALALAMIVAPQPAVDFLHTRLAPPQQRRIPRWAIWAGVGLLVLLAIVYLCYSQLQSRSEDVARLQRQLDENQPAVTSAKDFVSQFNFAAGFYGKNPRYLACLRDLTAAIPEDMQTYCTGLVMRQVSKPPAGSTAKPVNLDTISGVFTGRTTNQSGALAVLNHLKRLPAFTKVDLPSTADAGRTHEIQFTITFDYLQPKRIAGAAPAKGS